MLCWRYISKDRIMEQEERTLIDELHSKWLKLKSQKRPHRASLSKKPDSIVSKHIKDLNGFLSTTIDYGKTINNPVIRVELQWLAREIGLSPREVERCWMVSIITVDT